MLEKHVAGRRTGISGKRLNCDNNITERGESIPFQSFLLLFWPSSRSYKERFQVPGLYREPNGKENKIPNNETGQIKKIR